MPLSTVCTVSRRPKLWSSHAEIHAKNANIPHAKMNSTEDILRLRDPQILSTQNCYSPTLSRRLLGYGYELPDKLPKKDRKWSISNIFRRKKKDNNAVSSDSSSEEETTKRGFLGLKKRKPDKKRKSKTLGTFDHVVLSRQNFETNQTDSFAKTQSSSALYNTENKSKSVEDNIGNLVKKNRKISTKARAEARRITLKNEESSSEENGSQLSVSSSRFRSDEDGSLKDSIPGSRRSRAARTERFLRRQSRDIDLPPVLQLSKSDAENNPHFLSDSRKVLSLQQNRSNILPLSVSSTSMSLCSMPSGLRVSNSTCNPTYKPPLSLNDYNSTVGGKLGGNCEELDNQRSVSFDADIDKRGRQPFLGNASFLYASHDDPSFQNGVRDTNQVNLKFVKENQSLWTGKQGKNNVILRSSPPPPPPPRDPKRSVNAHYYDKYNATNPNFADSNNNSFEKSGDLYFLHKNGRSSSDNFLFGPRSSDNRPNSQQNVRLNTPIMDNDRYNYLTEKRPRSRRPIVIKSNSTSSGQKSEMPMQRAMNFWKEKDEEGVRSYHKFLNDSKLNQIPQTLQNGSSSETQPQKLTESQKDENGDTKRKSTNLEDALCELEAIYNSLRLGDEDLLERAEQKERLELEKSPEFNSLPLQRSPIHTNTFSYEFFEDYTRKPSAKKTNRNFSDDMAYRKINRNANTKRATTINDPQNYLSSVSYMQSSPLYCPGNSPENDVTPRCGTRKKREPDIQLDDVMFRNVNYAKNSLKINEPQLPFGIPLGPISTASNSDYLHSVPVLENEMTIKKVNKRSKIPDLVKDDLAYRNLRKDGGRQDLVLQPFGVAPKNGENFCDLRKKRAVRSLSANIGAMIEQSRFGNYKIANNEKISKDCEVIDRIADVMENARKLLKEKEKNITNTRRAFLSDTETVARAVQSPMERLEVRRSDFLNSLNGVGNYENSETNFGDYDSLNPTPKLIECKENNMECVVNGPKLDSNKLESPKNGSFEELLNALANEARETSERITKELQEFDERDKMKIINEERIYDQESDSPSHKNGGIIELETEKVGTDSEEIIHESRASIILQARQKPDNNSMDSEHDYENLLNCSTESIASIKEENIEDSSEFDGEFCDSSKNGERVYCDVADSFINAQIIALTMPIVHTSTNPQTSAVSEAAPSSLITTNQSASCVDSHSMKNLCDSPNNNNLLKCKSASLDSLDSLVSPKLVLEMSKLPKNELAKNSKKIEKNDSENRAGFLPAPRGTRLYNGSNSSSSTTPRELQCGANNKVGCAARNWYQDPSTLAVACSYGIACAHQLALLDLVSFLGLIFAVFSFFAALFL